MRELSGNLILRWICGTECGCGALGSLDELAEPEAAGQPERSAGAAVDPRDGTRVQANASHKRVVPIEVFLMPHADKKRIRSLDQDAGKPSVAFHGEWRSNQTQVPTTDPDAKLANKGNGTAAMVGYTVNGSCRRGRKPGEGGTHD